MKRILIIAVMIAMVLGFSIQAYAALELTGQGTSTHGTWNLIYDTDLDITWYDYTNTNFVDGTWQYHMNWADTLSVNFNGTAYDNWRLPTVIDIGNDGCNYSYNGTDCGYNMDTSTSELAHLWYDELGNISSKDTSGNFNPDWAGLSSTGDFQNLLPGGHWTGTELATGGDRVWFMNFNQGNTNPVTKSGHSNYIAIAVMEGRAVVPEPISSILFLIGGATLGFRRLLKQGKRES